MRILGIDPGSVVTGYGIIDHSSRQQCYVTSGCIKVGKKTISARLRQIYEDITMLIGEYAPTHVAIEKVFVHKNPASALKLGQARGVAIAAVACQELEIGEYSPREIKLAVVGYGNAAKEQVQHMTQLLLNLSARPQADAADALAVALCHGTVLDRKVA